MPFPFELLIALPAWDECCMALVPIALFEFEAFVPQEPLEPFVPIELLVLFAADCVPWRFNVSAVSECGVIAMYTGLPAESFACTRNDCGITWMSVKPACDSSWVIFCWISGLGMVPWFCIAELLPAYPLLAGPVTPDGAMLGPAGVLVAVAASAGAAPSARAAAVKTR